MTDQTAQTKTGRMIEIVEEDDIIRWQFEDPDTKQRTDSVFYLRIVPNAMQRERRKHYTTLEFTRRGREENFDWASFVDDCLDFAITNWESVMRRGQPLPCERQYKLRLPEVVKSEILRLCVGRELGDIVAGHIGHATLPESGGQDPNARSGNTSTGSPTLKAVATPPAAD